MGFGWTRLDWKGFAKTDGFKTEVERNDGETEEAELQALYSQAIAPFWDVQVGFRQDFQPHSESELGGHWSSRSLPPIFLKSIQHCLSEKSGRTALRLEAEYELLFTQRLILTPEIEVNLYGQNDEDLGIGSGLSDVEAGLRLRYEIRREFAPYIGVNWNKSFGNTADFGACRRRGHR